LDISSVPKISRAQAAQESARKFYLSVLVIVNSNLLLGPSALDTIGAPIAKSVSPAPQAPTAAETQSAYAEQLADVPEFADYGSVLNSSATPAQLTESETEYQVTCVKHIFKEHIVFQVRFHSFAWDWCCALTMKYSTTCQIRSPILSWNSFP
jgi:coatomer protein complex subunit gamma